MPDVSSMLALRAGPSGVRQHSGFDRLFQRYGIVLNRRFTQNRPNLVRSRARGLVGGGTYREFVTFLAEILMGGCGA